MTLADFYDREIKILAPTDRLKLASLILNDITSLPTGQTQVDVSEEWGENDLEEFAASNWQQIATNIAAERNDG